MSTIVNLVHNALVCYFNNVWFMFLVFLKKLLSFQTTVGPPLASIFRIFHSGSLLRRPPQE
jgi:hypothetical protein